ncbi:glyoxalase [bacterium]|jgi:catechol 2,3-dioxygenase-like lactoylglutathione lyase family enzyme|nr:glyoxalase [bacterium]
MIKEIRHTGIVVNDLKKSLWFYKEKMGFKVFKYMDESGPFIDKILGIKAVKVTTVKMILKNNQMIELLDFYTHRKDILCDSINDIGPTHLAFTVDNLDEMYSDFSNESVEFISAPEMSKDGNVKVAFCKAPEGTYIELVELQ